MSVVHDTWRQLVRRRLLPVVALLVGALVATPLVLAKNPKPVAATPAPAPEQGLRTADSHPVVDLVDHEVPTARRHVLGAVKDPFAPAPEPKAPRPRSTTRSSATVTGTTAAPAGGGITSVGSPTTVSGNPPALSPGGTAGAVGTNGSGSDVTPPPAVSTPAKDPAPAFPANSITVRFGDVSTDGEPAKSTLERLEPLPDADHPVVVFLGLQDDGKTALFLLDADVTVDGDGICHPDPAACDTFTLKAGETEFLDVASQDGGDPVQYELDLETIHHVVAKTSMAKAARRATAVKANAATAKPATARAAKAASAVRRLVRERMHDAGVRVAFDAHSGTVSLVREPAWHRVVERILRLGV